MVDEDQLGVLTGLLECAIEIQVISPGRIGRIKSPSSLTRSSREIREMFRDPTRDVIEVIDSVTEAAGR